jgi:hypothetical protein
MDNRVGGELMKPKPKIKFSHKYYKLPLNLQTATLLEVISCEVGDLSRPFLEYDTAYPFLDGTSYYELPKKGTVLVLIFLAGWAFTTIRRWTPEKEAYYRKLIGKEFEIVIS